MKTKDKEEFNLSEKIDAIDKIDEEHGILYVSIEDVKEFIRRQIDRIDKRIEELNEFDGLGEIMLQKAELRKVKDDLLKDIGDKLK